MTGSITLTTNPTINGVECFNKSHLVGIIVQSLGGWYSLDFNRGYWPHLNKSVFARRDFQFRCYQAAEYAMLTAAIEAAELDRLQNNIRNAEI